MAKTIVHCALYIDRATDISVKLVCQLVVKNRNNFLTLQFQSKPKCPPALLLSSEKHAKSSEPTLESSSIQTAEPIVKCHTIL